MREKAVLFGKMRSLVGIITDPPGAGRGRNLPAIILLNAGIVHRVGPNRVYVKMARDLTSMGFLVFRFDFSGVGDSKVRNDNLPFEKSAVSEAQEAMNYLSAVRGIEQFILLGICSGADISFKIACCDRRVIGAVLINAQTYQYGVSEALSSYIRNRKDSRYYWKIALFNPKSWMKAIQGKADYRGMLRAFGFQLGSLFGRKKKVSSDVNDVVADLRVLTEHGNRLLLVFSEGDPGLDYFQVILGDEIHELSSCGKLRVEIIQQAGHTFTPLSSQEHLLKLVRNWVHATVQG